MHELPTAATILHNLLVIEDFVDAPTCRALVVAHQQVGTRTSASDIGFPLHADNAMLVCPRHGRNAEQLVERDCQCHDIEVHPNHTAWRKLTALLYLDSDHDGGNIVFGNGPNGYRRLYRKE